VQVVSRDRVNFVARVVGERRHYFAKEFGLPPRPDAEYEIRQFLKTLDQLAIPRAVVITDVSGNLFTRHGSSEWQVSEEAGGLYQTTLNRAQVLTIGEALNKLHAETRTGQGFSRLATKLDALNALQGDVWGRGW